MHSSNSSRKIPNSSICTFPRVEFPFHDPVVHYSGHDIKRRVGVNVSLLDMYVFDIAQDLKVSSSLVGKVSKYSTTGSSIVAPSTLGSSLRESSSFRMISINITSPSSSLVQTSSALGDGGTNLSDSKSELSLRTFLVRNEIDGLGGVKELEWLSRLSLSSSSFSLVLSLRESLCSLGWIVMVVSERDVLPLSVELDFQARFNGGRMYSGHLESQEKDMVIKKLKERIKSLSGNMKEDKIKKEQEEIETINIELDHRSAKNSDLNASLQEKVLVITTLKDNLRKLKGKAVVDDAVPSYPIDPELLKVDVAPLALKLQNNRTVHSDYLKHT
nr:hypothetical protein [Tanacetum cinerariifolium]